jgi:NADH-quinone oxidoreductase subunit L
MPVIFYTFLAGAASLAALPFITAGFFSKEQILGFAYSAVNGNPVVWILGIIGAFITALYTTRLMAVVFWGEEKTHITHQPPKLMTYPLLVLAVFSIVAGYIQWPHNLVHLSAFSDFVSNVLPATEEKQNIASAFILQAVAVVATLAGIYFGYQYCYKEPVWKSPRYYTPTSQLVRNFWFRGWEFDSLYNNLFVKPFVFLTTINKRDVIDKIYIGITSGASRLYGLLSISQNGSLRWYIGGVLAGILIIITLQILI